MIVLYDTETTATQDKCSTHIDDSTATPPPVPGGGNAGSDTGAGVGLVVFNSNRLFPVSSAVWMVLRVRRDAVPQYFACSEPVPERPRVSLIYTAARHFHPAAD